MIHAMLAPLCLVFASPALAQSAGLQPDGRIVVTSSVNAAVQHYIEDIAGRYGALAVSQDGAKATAYICRSRLWKNCDDPGNEDSHLAVPSGKVARNQALTRCRSQSGAACILLFVNGDQQREFGVQP